jgi:hypothetical protein
MARETDQKEGKAPAQDTQKKRDQTFKRGGVWSLEEEEDAEDLF